MAVAAGVHYQTRPGVKDESPADVDVKAKNRTERLMNLNIFKGLKKLFRKKNRFFVLYDKYKIIPAFTFNGETFYMHEDPLNTLTGRGLTAMTHFEELLMRCEVSYLKDYCAAVKAILSDPKKIDILQLAKLNIHLEERVNFLAAVPEQVYKMASIVFFTKDESPFRYDQVIGAKHIAEWKEAPDMYDFFLRTPLKILIPSLGLPEQNSKTYLAVQEKISDIHFKNLQQLLSGKVSEDALKN